MQLYSGVLGKGLLYGPNRVQIAKVSSCYDDMTSSLRPIVQSDSLNV